MSITGFFLIDKPIGPTSHDVVDRLRQVTGERTIGHAGTLDPLASGLLVVAIGREFTKQIDRFKHLDKTYQAVVTLGDRSTTDDREGELTAVSSRQPGKDEVTQALKSLVGEYQQQPPIFSAKKIKGESAYKLARQGKPVLLEPVTVTINRIDLTSYQYPNLAFEVSVSAGTYIRSLAKDIGEKLKTGAYLSALRRTQIGDASINEAIKLDEIKSISDLETGKISSVI